MATNQGLSSVEHLSLPVHAGTASGDPVLAGTVVAAANDGIPGVALTAISAGDNPTGFASVATRGAWRVLVDTNTGVAVTVGDPIFYNMAADVLSSLNTDEIWGRALEALGAAAAGTILVAIQPRV